MISHHMSVVGMGFIDKIEARNVNPAFKARIVVITVIRLHLFASCAVKLPICSLMSVWLWNFKDGGS